MSNEERAIQKIEKEFNDNKSQLSQKGKIVSTAVMNLLKSFCQQNSKFAQLIEQSSGTIVECINATVKNCGNSISDLMLYTKVMQFYFPDAIVHNIISIDLGEGTLNSIELEPEPEPEPESKPTFTTKLEPTCLQLTLDNLVGGEFHEEGKSFSAS